MAFAVAPWEPLTKLGPYMVLHIPLQLVLGEVLEEEANLGQVRISVSLSILLVWLAVVALA